MLRIHACFCLGRMYVVHILHPRCAALVPSPPPVSTAAYASTSCSTSWSTASCVRVWIFDPHPGAFCPKTAKGELVDPRNFFVRTSLTHNSLLGDKVLGIGVGHYDILSVVTGLEGLLMRHHTMTLDTHQNQPSCCAWERARRGRTSVVVLTLTRIIKSVVTGQAPWVTLEWRGKIPQEKTHKTKPKVVCAFIIAEAIHYSARRI